MGDHQVPIYSSSCGDGCQAQTVFMPHIGEYRVRCYRLDESGEWKVEKEWWHRSELTALARHDELEKLHVVRRT